MESTIKAFIQKLSRLEPSKSPQEKFRDLCEMAYCAYAKPVASVEQKEALESRYMQIVGTYRDKDAVWAYPELLAMVYEGVKSGDYLGSVAAEIGALNDAQGQFFTPFEVSRLLAEMTFGQHEPLIEKYGHLTLQEPAAGAGGMVLAFALVMRQRGYEPSSQLFVSAIDISAPCYWMCYLQLTLAGIPAEVISGNTLSQETFESAWTASAIPFLGKHGDIFENKPSSRQSKTVELLSKLPEMKQLALF